MAWGPIAHSTFNCQGSASWTGIDPSTCMAATTALSPSFATLVGSDFADALAFGKFNISGQASRGYLCEDLSYMHSAAFGIFMFQAAKAHATGALNQAQAMSFAQAFFGHVLCDAVGFYPISGFNRGGILCSAESGGCSPTQVQYLPLWSFMADLDLVFATANGIDKPTQLPDVSGLGKAAYSWVADMSTRFNKVDASFKPVTSEAVEQCINFWKFDQRWVYKRAELFMSSTATKKAIAEEISFFLGAQTKVDVIEYLAQQTLCASTVIENAISEALNGTEPAQVQAHAIATVKEMYNKGLCSPTQ